MVEHNVRYTDDAGIFAYGDFTDGSPPAVSPPAWASGRRFFSPNGYRWHGEYDNVITNGDLRAVLGFVAPAAAITCPRRGEPY